MERRFALVPMALLALIGPSGAAFAKIAVELVTVGPDHALDTRFGHILLRVFDAETGSDDAYDFGVADFQRPGFAAEAALGRAKFYLRRSPAQIRFDDYASSDRDIVAQRLNLSDEQIARLLERLEWNLRPENVEYAYDHVADNCSTRLRDLLDDVTGGALQRAAYEIPASRTYREDILAAGSGRTLALVVFDFVSGPHGEDRVGVWQLTFIPEQMRELLAVAENSALGVGTPLVAFERALHRRSAAPAVGGSVDAGRHAVVGIGAALGLFFGLIGTTAWLTRRDRPWLSRLAGLALIPTAALFGSLGVALLPISLFSTGTIWVSNQNAWFFFPLDLLLLGPALRWVWTGRATFATWSRVYIDLRFLMIVVGWTGVAHPQDNMAFALASLLTLLGLRTFPLHDT